MRSRARQAQDGLGQFQDGDLVGIAEVHRPGLVRGEHTDEAVDEVGDVAEAAGLAAIPVDGQRFTLQCLRDEVGHDPAIVGTQTRAVGVEDPDDAGVDLPGRRWAMNSASAYRFDSS